MGSHLVSCAGFQYAPLLVAKGDRPLGRRRLQSPPRCRRRARPDARHTTAKAALSVAPLDGGSLTAGWRCALQASLTVSHVLAS